MMLHLAPETGGNLYRCRVEGNDDDLTITTHSGLTIGRGEGGLDLLKKLGLPITNPALKLVVNLRRQKKQDVDVPRRAHPCLLSP